MWLKSVTSITLLLTMAGTSMAAPQFTPRATHIEHQYLGGWEHFVGGGVAAFDCNDDQRPELYLAGGSEPATLLRNTTGEHGADIEFEVMDAGELAVTGVTGAYPININNNDHIDLVVLRVGENLLFEGQGDCQFTRSDLLDGLEGDAWTTAFSATWEAGETLPTLAFGNYVNRDDPDGPFGACDDNHVLRPQGERYDALTLLTPLLTGA